MIHELQDALIIGYETFQERQVDTPFETAYLQLM